MSSEVAPKAHSPAAPLRICKWLMTAAFGRPVIKVIHALKHFLKRIHV